METLWLPSLQVKSRFSQLEDPLYLTPLQAGQEQAHIGVSDTMDDQILRKCP